MLADNLSWAQLITQLVILTYVGEDLRLASGGKSLHLLKDLFSVIDSWGGVLPTLHGCRED